MYITLDTRAEQTKGHFNLWVGGLLNDLICGLVFAVSLLKDLKQANIVTLHDIVHTERSLTLVFEYLVSSMNDQTD